jgi:hypothetical protein
MAEFKKGNCEFRLYEYDYSQLVHELELMVNSSNKWEIYKIFEPVNYKVKVLFRIQYKETVTV